APVTFALCCRMKFQSRRAKRERPNEIRKRRRRVKKKPLKDRQLRKSRRRRKSRQRKLRNNLWDKKLIRLAFAWALIATGVRGGMPRRRNCRRSCTAIWRFALT